MAVQVTFELDDEAAEALRSGLMSAERSRNPGTPTHAALLIALRAVKEAIRTAGQTPGRS